MYRHCRQVSDHDCRIEITDVPVNIPHCISFYIAAFAAWDASSSTATLRIFFIVDR